jgi:threonine dehydratase
MSTQPITIHDVHAARERLRPYLPPTPLRHYRALDTAVGSDIRVLVKHENHQPTNAFKVRNALAVITSMSAEQKRRGIVAATRGNHGQALAWAGELLGVPVTVCVPHGNNPEKNAAVRGFGAELIEEGRDYDESIEVAQKLVVERGMHMVHAANDRQVIAGAATITHEVFEQATLQGEKLDAIVVAIGGGAHAVGALIVAHSQRPDLPVYGVQADHASTIHDSWHAGKPVTGSSVATIADGLATRSCYELTFPALREGLRGFVTVSEAEIAESLRMLLRTTHNLVEGAGATPLAGVRKLATELAGKTVAVFLTGGNIDEATLRTVIHPRS